MREKFLLLESRGEVTATEVANRCGWAALQKNGKRKPDGSRVNRALGITKESDGHGYRKEISEDVAILLCRALHADPWEVGL